MDRLNEIFTSVFGVGIEALGPEFTREKIANWDSVRQLSLTNAMEDAFDIMLDPEDILGCTSYENAKQILKKYEVAL